ncbi:ABC transporter permease [Pseudonocardia hispaniensis]|uniref:ABC transporter permease n=1 Tax=Pseudonocardia hispaniensis TaxID=904933 RepID=A0ABW1IYG4_9PSEU
MTASTLDRSRTVRGHRGRAALAKAGVVVTVVALNFLLPRALPGDPLLAMSDPASAQYLADPEIRARVERHYGLDRPLLEQLRDYLTQLLHGDLGWSIHYRRPVAELLGDRLGWTLVLVVPSITLAFAITVGLGVEAGWRRGTRADQAMIALFTVVHSIPVYLAALLGILLFSVRLGWLPLSGAATPFAEFGHVGQWLADVAWHASLPIAVLTVSIAGGRFLLMRNTTVTVLGEPFVRVARAVGLPARSVKYAHVARNAVLPVVTGFGLTLGFAVGGTIFVESIFDYPGMGRLVFEAVGARDYPLLGGCFLVLSLCVLGASWTVEALTRRLDPRTAPR